MIKRFGISRYDVSFGSLMDVSINLNGTNFHCYAVITCYGDDGTILALYFPSDDSLHAQPVSNLAKNYGSVIMQPNTLDAALALLEKGAFGIVHESNPNWNVLTTNKNM